MPLTQIHRHYFTIEQRETLQRLLEARAAVLREEVGEDVKADLNAEPEAVALKLDVVELRAVESALERLHTPDFGLCEDCAAEISYARLSANPTAVRCLGCQAQRERGPGPAPRA
jgi:RNA polymerase-binding transcription factor DksA